MYQKTSVEADDISIPADELSPGHKLMQGQYTIQSFLQAGGFGLTYLATNSLGRKVIVKECFAGSFCRRSASSVRPRSSLHSGNFASLVQKFISEAHNLAKVKHPNIVAVHEVFEENDTAYMVLDYIEGHDLLDLIEAKDQEPTPSQIEAMFKKVLDALGAIHKQGLLHRDISPDNIMLTSDLEPILIDFGAAREDIGPESRKVSELRVVKDGYSPQEFYIAGAEQGPASDLYSLAASFYHLITGEAPIASQKRIAAVATKNDDPLVPVSGRFSGYSTPFLQCIDKAMAVLSKDRIASVDAWLGLLEGAVPFDESSERTPTNGATSGAEDETKSVMKSRILAGIGLAVPMIGAIYMLTVGNDETAAPVTAPTAQAALQDIVLDPALTQGASPISNLEIGSVAPKEDAAVPDTAPAINFGAIDIAPFKADETPVDAAPLDATAETETIATATPTDLTLDQIVAVAPSAPEGIDAFPSLDTIVLDEVQPQLDQAVAAVIPETPAPFVAEEFDLSDVVSAWTVDLANVLQSSDGQIYAINGMPIDSGTAIDNALHLMMAAPESSTLNLSILHGFSEDVAVTENVTVPVTHKTTFPNGEMLETRFIDSGWRTIVITAPDSSDLLAGDELVGDAGTGRRYDSRTALPERIIEAKAQGLDRIAVALRRNNELLVADMRISR